MLRSTAFFVFLVSYIAAFAQADLVQLTSDNWKDHAQFLSPQPDSKFHNVCTRFVLRTGNVLNPLGVMQNETLISIEGEDSGSHEYQITISRDNQTINVIPRSNFDLEELVTITIYGGILDTDSNLELALEWSFYTSGKLPDAWTYIAPEEDPDAERVFPSWTILSDPIAGLAPGNFFSSAAGSATGMAVLSGDAASNPLWFWDDMYRGQDFKINRR